MKKTFKEYEKENTVVCPNCHIQIKTNLIPMSIFDNIHEDMYISHEDEYLERKALQQRISKAIGYANANMERLGVWNHLVKEMIKILRGE